MSAHISWPDTKNKFQIATLLNTIRHIACCICTHTRIVYLQYLGMSIIFFIIFCIFPVFYYKQFNKAKIYIKSGRLTPARSYDPFYSITPTGCASLAIPSSSVSESYPKSISSSRSSVESRSRSVLSFTFL